MRGTEGRRSEEGGVKKEAKKGGEEMEGWREGGEEGWWKGGLTQRQRADGTDRHRQTD